MKCQRRFHPSTTTTTTTTTSATADARRDIFEFEKRSHGPLERKRVVSVRLVVCVGEAKVDFIKATARSASVGIFFATCPSSSPSAAA